jgi:hypothetical protein
VTSTEDRARAAMRAIAGTVQGAPPLRLTTAAAPAAAGAEARLQGRGPRPLDPRRPGGAARPGNRGWRRHPRWSVLAPVAAAVTIVAVAIALAVARNSPGGAAAPTPASSASPASAPTFTTAAGVPRYYVAWMQADRPYLIVGDTLTGQVRATVKAPGNNVDFTAVYGTADSDSTFIVTGAFIHGPPLGTIWYLLRIAPGSHYPARLTPLGIPGEPDPAGVALSPDGTELAVALSGKPGTLRIYSVPTGTLLRSWSATVKHAITAGQAPLGSWQFTAMALRWFADGRRLAFAWDASAIRVLDASAPDGDLIGSSSQLAAIGKTYATDASFTCKAWQGWAPITVARGASAGQGVICGGGAQNEMPQAVSGTASPTAASAGSATCTPRNQPSIGFLGSTKDGLGESYLGLTTGETECPGAAQASDGAYIGWSNADGSVLIGSLAWDGHVRFGIFRGSRFTPLPALPVSVPVPAGVLVGTVAW